MAEEATVDKSDQNVTVDGDTDVNVDGLDTSDPGVKEYIQKMADKADKGTSTSTDTGEDLLAGKYKSREDLINGINELKLKDVSDEDLVKQYKELESGVGSQDSDADAGSDTDGDASDDSQDSTTDDAGDADADAGDADTTDDGDSSDADTDAVTKITDEMMDKYNAELAEGDKLSDGSYQELEALGINRAMVDAMVQGINYQKSQLYEVAGGKELYDSMLEWAGDNMNKAEIETFNQAFDSGDMEQMKASVELLKTKYGQKNSLPPKKKIEPKGHSTTPVTGYENKAALTKDMRDPRYQKDPKFRASVMAKISKTPWM